MATTASEVIALAQKSRALSQDQLDRVLRLAPTMTTQDLEMLKLMLVTAPKQSVADMQKELDLRKRISAAQAEWESDRSRDALQTQEGAVKREDHAQAENLIQRL